MKIKIRPDDASMLQMNDWLAELRDDGRAEPPDDGGAVPASSDARPETPAEQAAAAERTPPAEQAAPAEPAASGGSTVRAVIGDQLRMPIMWCEMGSCISWHADPAALGESDARARAIGAGWCIDAFGRLACPQCQQHDPGFWTAHPVVPWDRYAALARGAGVSQRG